MLQHKLVCSFVQHMITRELLFVLNKIDYDTMSNLL